MGCVVGQDRAGQGAGSAYFGSHCGDATADESTTKFILAHAVHGSEERRREPRWCADDVRSGGWATCRKRKQQRQGERIVGGAERSGAVRRCDALQCDAKVVGDAGSCHWWWWVVLQEREARPVRGLRCGLWAPSPAWSVWSVCGLCVVCSPVGNNDVSMWKWMALSAMNGERRNER